MSTGNPLRDHDTPQLGDAKRPVEMPCSSRRADIVTVVVPTSMSTPSSSTTPGTPIPVTATRDAGQAGPVKLRSGTPLSPSEERYFSLGL